MRTLLSFLFFTLGGFASVVSTQAEPEVKITPIEDWITPSDWDREHSSRERNHGDRDTHYLLYEQQVDARSDITKTYRHYAYRFLTGNAVQDESQIEISFDPEYQTVEFHSLIVHRDGEAIDRLATQPIKIIQREEDMNRHLYDGRLSAILVLEDIRIGDILEYSFTRKGSNPIFEGHFMKSFSTQWGIPVEKAKFRLLWPGDRPIQVKSHQNEITPTITKKDGFEEYLWDFSEGVPHDSDGDVPSWYDPWGWVQLTDFSSWKEVSKWAAGVYRDSNQLPPELAAFSKSIKKSGTAEEQAFQAVQYVQDQIRYLGVESGVNSHKPYPLKTIINRRFGDCKDKSVLLSAVLRDLGFEAYPALVDTSDRRTIGEWLPSAFAFNHVIVQLRLDDQIVWIDPTIRLQGGTLRTLYFPNYGRALVVAPDTVGLQEIKRDAQNTSFIEIKELFDFQDYEGNAILRVTTSYKGDEADRMRRVLSESSVSDLAKDYRNFYSDIYKKVKSIDPLKFHDNRTENVVVCFENYYLSDYWRERELDDDESEERISGKFNARTFASFLETPDTRERTMPFSLIYPMSVSHEIVADLPWPLDFNTDEVSFDTNSFAGSFKRSSSDGSLRLKMSYESKNDFVSAEEFPDYLQKIEQLEEKSYYSFTVPAIWVGDDATESEEEETETVVEAKMSDEVELFSGVVKWILIAFTVILVILVCFIVVLIRATKKHRKITPPPLPKRF